MRFAVPSSLLPTANRLPQTAYFLLTKRCRHWSIGPANAGPKPIALQLILLFFGIPFGDGHQPLLTCKQWHGFQKSGHNRQEKLSVFVPPFEGIKFLCQNMLI